MTEDSPTQPTSDSPAPAAPAPPTSVWARIKDHKIAQWTLAYAAAAYALLDGTKILSEAFDWPHWLLRAVAALLVLGLPLMVTLAWYHGHRALRRVSGAELTIITVLLVMAGAVLWHFAHQSEESVPSKAASTGQGTAAPGVAISDKSIAVLPFADMSEKHDQEYFGDGMAEEILNLLVKIPHLRVIGRTSSFSFKGRNEDLRAIGAKLNAAYVLEGSVRKSGNTVRITTQLINTRTGTHEWSQTYDRPIGDVLMLQDAIATSIVRELEITVASGYLKSRFTLNNTEAYDLYLRGSNALDRYDSEGFDEAVSLFQQALDRDPTFADAAVLLGWAYVSQAEWGFLSPAVGFERARRAATMALRLDPKSAEAHAILATIHVIYDWDWIAAERELRLASSLAPGNADSLLIKAYLSGALGQWDDALRQTEDYLTREPLDPGGFAVLSQIQDRRRHLPEAEAAARRALDILPTYSYGHYLLGRVLLARGDSNAALATMQRDEDDSAKQLGLPLAYFALGRKAESDAALARLINDQANKSAFAIAEVYSFRRQLDEAMHWLERAYAQKDNGLCWVKDDPLLISLKGDPRLLSFLKKMNLPE